MKLSAKSSGEIAIELDGKPGGPIPIETPLGPLGFRSGWLSGLFFGTIPTEDAQRSPHVVYLRLQLKGDTLSGTVSAVAISQTFALPYWASLKRRPDAGGAVQQRRRTLGSLNFLARPEAATK